MNSKKAVKSEWIDTVLRRGTIADRIAAHTLLIQENGDWKSLEALLAMVDPRKCRRQCIMAMTTLKELFSEKKYFGDKKERKEIRRPPQSCGI